MATVSHLTTMHLVIKKEEENLYSNFTNTVWFICLSKLNKKLGADIGQLDLNLVSSTNGAQKSLFSIDNPRDDKWSMARVKIDQQTFDYSFYLAFDATASAYKKADIQLGVDNSQFIAYSSSSSFLLFYVNHFRISSPILNLNSSILCGRVSQNVRLRF